MNIFKLVRRWFGWMLYPSFDDVQRSERLEAIDHEVDNIMVQRTLLRGQIATLRRRKKRFSHLEAELNELTNRQLRLESMADAAILAR